MADEPLSFQDAHDAKHGPDPEHVCRDDLGVKFFEFTCSFDDGDKQYSFNIWALDMDDAQRRLDCLKATARLDGQLWGRIPV